MANKIFMSVNEDSRGKFSFAKLLTRKVASESPECRRYHHTIRFPGGTNWTLREVRGALSTMVDGATSRGGRWFWSVSGVRRINARTFSFVARERKDV